MNDVYGDFNDYYFGLLNGIKLLQRQTGLDEFQNLSEMYRDVLEEVRTVLNHVSGDHDISGFLDDRINQLGVEVVQANSERECHGGCEKYERRYWSKLFLLKFTREYRDSLRG